MSELVIEGLEVNEQGAEWQAIERVVRRRMQALVEETMSPTLSDEQRRDRVARHDELALLLKVPADARQRAVAVTEARLSGSTGGMY